jgi:hypothetical protein
MSYAYGGGVDVVEEGVCGRQWRILPLQRPGWSDPYVGVLYTTDTNFNSRAPYIDAGGATHCPLINGLRSIRAWEGRLDHFDQVHLEINSNKHVLTVIRGYWSLDMDAYQ